MLVAVNYAKYVVDIAQGYYLGEPVKYDANETHEAEDSPQGGKRGFDVSQAPEDKNGPQSGAQTEPDVKEGQHIDLSPLLEAYDRQHISEVDSRIGKGMGVYGECLEVCYALRPGTGAEKRLHRPHGRDSGGGFHGGA